MQRKIPSVDDWLRQAKAHPSAPKIGMYLAHNGVVRRSAKAQVRLGEENAPPVTAMDISVDWAGMEAALADTRAMPGIYHVRAWLNEGCLPVGADIMLVLIGGDIRPRVVEALDYLVGRLKTECITEREHTAKQQKP